LGAEVIAMSFAGEWILAVHKAIWFPVLWATGLEAAAAEDDWFGVREPEAAPLVRRRARRTKRVQDISAPLIRRRAA